MDLYYFKHLKNAIRSRNLVAQSTLFASKIYYVPQEMVENPRSDLAIELKIATVKDAAAKVQFDKMWIEYGGDATKVLPNGASIFGFQSLEVAPGRYDCVAITSHGSRSFGICLDGDGLILHSQTASVTYDTEQWLALLFANTVIELAKRNVQHGVAKRSKLVNGRILPFEVTYVRQKKTIYERNLFPENVEWKHSWHVCGHWRKISGIGKDRVGKRTVEGMTWCNPHIRGCGTLIDKVRVLVSK